MNDSNRFTFFQETKEFCREKVSFPIYKQCSPLIGITVNWITVNGITVNWITVNGITVNGITVNGITVNGITVYGMTVNGIMVNGITVNGVTLNGITLNGSTINRIIQLKRSMFLRYLWPVWLIESVCLGPKVIPLSSTHFTEYS